MTLPRITVCGLGPGGAGAVTTATLDAIARSTVRFLRTTRHPTAHLVAGAASFDHLYEAADSFDQVYAAIADALVAAATEAASPGPGEGASVLYAVPGSPLVLEDSVRRLRADGRVAVDLVPALSFLDEVWARLGVDPVDDGVRLVDGHRFGVQAAGERGPLLVAHVHAPWVLSEIKLALDAGDEQRVVVLQGLGTPHERVFEVTWPDLDRVVTPDHLTSLYLPELAAPVAAELAASVELMARLRRDCPWDRAQTHQSLRRYLLEEAYEVLEAIDRLPERPGDGGPVADQSAADELAADDGYELLEEELGDLWFQILFHSQLAAEAGRFTVADVARTLHDKLVGRHPHVFGDVAVADAGEVVANWERIKQEEKQRSSVLDGIPAALPALSLADKVLQRAERAGWATDIGPSGPSMAGLLPPGARSEDLGRALLALVVAGRADHLDAEAALRSAVTAAERRFRQAEESGARSDSWVLG